jgi:hypothetical protein
MEKWSDGDTGEWSTVEWREDEVAVMTRSRVL